MVRIIMKVAVKEAQIEAVKNVLMEYPIWLGPLNFIILQWFFIRLVAVFDAGTGKRINWFWWFPVMPLTKWKWNV